jgi:hypothetical protein
MKDPSTSSATTRGPVARPAGVEVAATDAQDSDADDDEAAPDDDEDDEADPDDGKHPHVPAR